MAQIVGIPETIVTPSDTTQRKGERAREITANFMALYHMHLEELFSGRATFRMSTSKYAEKLFINKRHLTNTLKATTGKSPCEFMENAIAEEAKRLLIETHLSIAEISSRFAWDEPTNFVKFFKGMVGETPLQFRKKNLKEKSGA